MSKVLVYLQHENGKLSKVSRAALTAASKLANDILGICLGTGSQAAANDAAKYGLTKVLYSESDNFSKFIASNAASVIAQTAEQESCDVVIAAATSEGRDALPIVAAKLDAGQASDVLEVNSDGSLKRPMYAGNVIADVELLTSKKVITVRASSFEPKAEGGGAGTVEEITSLPEFSSNAEVISYEKPDKGRPDLNDADIVVSGGRAFGSTENFEKYLYPLADKLGAAIGASRAAVDSGYVPNDWQVGQTGKIVAPNLYIAIGLSGAIQHLAGMKDSKIIVAINKDAEAPIFEIADYGLVADLFEVLPEIVEKI